MTRFLFLQSGILIFSLQTIAQVPFELPLWKSGAPGFEYLANSKELKKDYWVRNIHNPSITVYLPPKEIANGTAVIICPGGGHRLLVFDAEGTEPARYLNSLGVTAIILKYRLAREDSVHYKLLETAQQDATRAMKLVRFHAKKWNIDTSRIGWLGFSAGGEVVSSVAYANSKTKTASLDSVDKMSTLAAFQILVYPGPLGIPDSIPVNAPPALLIAANDDVCCSPPVIKLLAAYRQMNLPVEVHLYTKGGHGFNMGNRSDLSSIQHWKDRMKDWLNDKKLLMKN